MTLYEEISERAKALSDDEKHELVEILLEQVLQSRREREPHPAQLVLGKRGT